MKSSPILSQLIKTLPAVSRQHAPTSDLYALLKAVARAEVEKLFSSKEETPVDISPLGTIVFPYISMGSVDSLNLFDLDELIIFSFYAQNRGRYKAALDIGANLGLHSIMMSLCGMSVSCFEPDPKHFDLLNCNLKLNKISSVTPNAAAVSDADGETEFVRVLGNTTGSHLAGAKRKDPYGDIERFPVKIRSFREIIKGVDLVKLDAEGQEREILLSTNSADWDKLDALVEVQDAENAALLYDHFVKTDVNMFCQKSGWAKASSADDVPTGYKEGTLFLTKKAEMPWSEKSLTA